MSCGAPEYRVELRRLIHADQNPQGPGRKEEVVDHPVNREVFRGEEQHIRAGSCMVVETPPPLGEMVLTGAFRPTLAKAGPQTLFALTDSAGRVFRATLGPEGLVLSGPDGAASKAVPVPVNQWRRFRLHLDLRGGAMRLSWESPRFNPLGGGGTLSLAFDPSGDAVLAGLVFAASGVGCAGRQSIVHDPFNGRLADLRLSDGAGRPVAAWDFVAEAASEIVPDVAGGNAPGRTINRPTRLVAGPDLEGQARWATDAPGLFNAAHFHDDDLADAGWTESFAF
ncbi:hypothetical protein, partial [Sphingobium wenxiniae]